MIKSKNINKTPIVSIIIRTKNEEKYLTQVLDMLKQQTLQDFEIIVVDDCSTDKTLEISKNYNCKIIIIPEGRFSHPYSCNLGAENAKGEYLVYLNGHSIPTSKKFLENGINNFKDEKIAGVFSYPLAHNDGTFADKIIYNILSCTIGTIKFNAKESIPGILGTTNAIIRKDLWKKYNFDENLNNGMGGEDIDWAKHFIILGYKIIHDPKFKVYHSHHLQIKDILWQYKNWRKMSLPKGMPEKQRKYF